MTFHKGPNGPGKCNAKKGKCPFGGESGEENHFATMEEATKAFNEEQTAKHGALGGVKKKSSLPRELKATARGKKNYQAWKASWKDYWDKTYKAYYNTTPEEMEGDDRKKALALRGEGGTFDGAWVPQQQDGGVAIPAGKYYFVTTDGWESTEEGLDPQVKASTDAWKAQAYADTPPGAANGAYLEGKPAYLLTAADMGQNHGYDGEILVPEDTYKKLREHGYFAEEELYGEATSVEVPQDTVIYGYMGNMDKAPEGLSFATSEGGDTPEQTAYLNAATGVDPETDEEVKAPSGSVFNHPHLRWEMNKYEG